MRLSEEGSNERSKEDSTIYCFEIFLQDLGGDVMDYHLKIFSYLSPEQIVYHHWGLVRKSHLIFTILSKIAVVSPMPQHVDCIFS